MSIDAPEFKTIGVNTDFNFFNVSNYYKPLSCRLKERQIRHIKIQTSKELEQAYVLGEQIGQGAFGIVSSIVERSTSKPWAMKIVIKAKAGERLKLVQREIQILRLIEHPHIIYLDRIYESSQKIYMILEKCCGQLASVYEERKPFPEDVLHKIMLALTSALTYLHKYDIVHRDLKMENILMAVNPNDPHDEYYVKISDFGLSIIKSGSGIDYMLHDYCGTLLYMSPEILKNCSYSQQCDIWSLGIILYMLAFGHNPFYADSERDLLNKICTEEPIYANTVLTKEIINLIQSLLNKNPANRLMAVEILEHPWIRKRPLYLRNTSNILDIMKEWKSEMTKKSLIDPNESTTIQQELKSTGTRDRTSYGLNPRQAMVLPKTNVKFNRQHNLRESKDKNGISNTGGRSVLNQNMRWKSAEKK